jgi:RimJ/RimL family protein N-acetyltransferase
MTPRPTLTTARLLLRPFTLGDAPRVRELAGDRAIADTTLSIPHPYEQGVAEQWIATHQEHFEQGIAVTFAVVLAAEPTLIGTVGLRISRRHDRAELGYWIGQPYWGQGYASEAAAAVVDFGFQRQGLNRITAHHFLRNPSSGRVMQKIGMTCEGTLRQHVRRWQAYEDVVVYGILRDEWAQHRK